jgi:flavin-dependent dehydrogenase
MVLWSEDSFNIKAETVRHPDPPGLMVDRGRFDHLLLSHARQAGARILQPGLARAPRRMEGGWLVPVSTVDGEWEVYARFVVDASGRSSRLGGHRERTGPRTLALYGTWVRREVWGSETRVEAGPDEWLWAALRPDGTLSAMVFVDAERYRVARTAGIAREALYRSLLARSALLAEAPACAELTGCVGVCEATRWHDPEPVGDGFLKVGEAAFALDPLSSTGVQKALQTAWSGAIAVHTILTLPAGGEAARRFYAESHWATVERHAAWAAEFYAQARRQHAGRPFWRSRVGTEVPRPSPRPETVAPAVSRAPTTGLRLSALAALVERPCITGNLIEMRRALVHPGLEQPVAFLDGVEIAPLLEAIPAGAALEELTAVWSRRLPQSLSQQAAALADWLIRHEILVPC